MTENIASSAVASVGVKRPTLRFMLSHPAHVISLGFGSGLAPFAPGTFGTLVGLFAARWLQPMVGDTIFFLGLAVAFALSVWAAGVTGRALGESDHGSIVSDEVIAMALITAMLPGAAWKQLWAFLLFRLLDIWKPGPIGWADRNVKGAFGVMLDDLIAAALTLLIFALWIRYF
ncbi:MAG TPA: phosphatidylglycerophosphatase A [Casimicrobium sp.]|jgi:phosphatidylglycerophosphatase A|nr:phosphatidylglycerophosphatase A [Casimicrobium sp.]HPV23323.1 phosphatidylglycerophosphatase A [Casimicrobium sp.]